MVVKARRFKSWKWNSYF